MDRLDRIAARLARKHLGTPWASEQEVFDGCAGSLWFASLQVNVAAAILVRPVKRFLCRA